MWEQMLAPLATFRLCRPLQDPPARTVCLTDRYLAPAARVIHGLRSGVSGRRQGLAGWVCPSWCPFGWGDGQAEIPTPQAPGPAGANGCVDTTQAEAYYACANNEGAQYANTERPLHNVPIEEARYVTA